MNLAPVVITKLPRSTRNQQGFSLVEVMVCVAIIGVLSAIAVPNYDFMLGKARISRVTAEVGQINISILALKALYGYYPNTQSTWNAALPFAAEYPLNCAAVNMGAGAENDQAVTDFCKIMMSLNPGDAGMPKQSPVCAEPRDYLYVSNGRGYQVMGYCFDHSELSSKANPGRCAGGVCWGVSFSSTVPALGG